MEPEPVKFEIKEHIRLEKFEGPMLGQEPVEVLELEDGKIISHHTATAKEL